MTLFLVWCAAAIAGFLLLLLVVVSCVLAGMEEQEMGEWWHDEVKL